MEGDEARTVTRLANRQHVVRSVLEAGRASRSQLASRTALSKPTVSDIVRELVDEGWLVEGGRSSGAVGRTATLYEFNRDAGRVIGVDLGGTKIRAAICDLAGGLLDERVEPTDVRGGRHVAEQLVGLCRRLTGGRDDLVHAVAIGGPGVPDPVTGAMDLAVNIPGFGDVPLRDQLRRDLGVDVAIENDVNMAALGERWHGNAVGVDDAVFVALGTGVGLGLICDGELRRGRRGAAGEIAYLPLGTDPLDRDNIHRGPLEEAVKGAAIVSRYAVAAGGSGAPRLDDVRSILAAAEAGEPTADRVVTDVARDLALGIVAVVAVVDPELVVLGGGIGANPTFARYVAEVLPTVTEQAPRMVVSALGDRASLVGALAVALRTAHQRLFGAGEATGSWPLAGSFGSATAAP